MRRDPLEHDFQAGPKQRGYLFVFKVKQFLPETARLTVQYVHQHAIGLDLARQTTLHGPRYQRLIQRR
ncbi:MAG TPA: hypothetical protein VF797_06995 [Noviherbaspirillum sp.]